MEGVNTYVIYSVTGEEIKKGENNSISLIDVSELPYGLYFVKVNETDRFKILIRH